MTDSASGLIEVGSPRRTGDNWQYAVRPAESLDAAEVEILTEPEPHPADAEQPVEDKD
jgi:hypothetical protein